MNTLKHFTAPVLTLLFVFCLAACGRDGPAAQPDPTYQDRLHLVTDPYGPLLKETAASESGYYELLLSTDAQSNNILYTDFETRQRIYLCGSPSCAHRDETCTSWTDHVVGGSFLFTDPQTDNVFYVQRGLEERGSGEEGTHAEIFSMQQDGSRRTLLLGLASDGRICDAVAADSQYLYLDVSTVDRRSADPKKQTWRVRLSDGQKDVLIPELPANDRLFGAYDTFLLFQEQNGDSCAFRSFDLRTGQFQEVCGWQYNAFEGISILYDHRLFVLAKKTPDSGVLTVFDLRSGQTDTIDDVPVYGGSVTSFSGLWADRYLLVDTTDNSDPSNIRFLRCVVDLSEKTVTENTLSFVHNGAVHPIWVLAQHGDSLLVRCGERQGIVHSLYDGQSVETAVPDAPVLALIPIESFVGNAPDYLPVTDHVMQ